MSGVEVGVGAVVVRDGALLLVQRGRPPYVGYWAVPGGKIRPGERLAEAVRRETREETGITVDVGDVAWVGETIGPGDPPTWHYVLIDFTATWISGEIRPADDAAAVRWVPLDEVRNLRLTPTMPALLEVIDG